MCEADQLRIPAGEFWRTPFTLGLCLVACATAPKQRVPVHRATTPELRRDCFAVITAAPTEAYLLTFFADVRALSDVIRTDDPDVGETVVEHRCSKSPCATWGEYHAPEVNWYFSRLGAGIVAGRKPKIGDAVDKDLDTQTLGNFAIAILRKPDFSCGANPQERCSTYQDGDSSPCEHDFSVPCSENGVEAMLEVLDVSKMIVHRIEDVRHLKNWRASLRSDGGLRVELDDCVVDF